MRPGARSRTRVRERCSTTMAPTGRPSAIIGETSRLLAPGMSSLRSGFDTGLTRLTSDEVAPLPRLRDDRVRGAGRRRRFGDPAGCKDDDVAIDRAEDGATLEPEPRGQPVEHDACLEDRVGHVVESRADVDERLEIRAALAQLALVHRGEDRRRQREQPERGHVEDRHPIEVDRQRPGSRPPAGRAWRPGRTARRTAAANATAPP